MVSSVLGNMILRLAAMLKTQFGTQIILPQIVTRLCGCVYEHVCALVSGCVYEHVYVHALVPGCVVVCMSMCMCMCMNWYQDVCMSMCMCMHWYQDV